MKKVIKAHRGMAHVPKPSGQQAPTKGEGSPLRGRRRRIGLPQRFRGRSPLANQIRIREALRKGRGRNQRNDIGTQPLQTAPTRQPRLVRPSKPMPEPTIVKKPTVRPPKIMDGEGGRGGRPTRIQGIQPPRPSDAGMGGRPTRIIGRPPRPSDAGMGGRPRLMATPRRQMPPKRQPRPQFTPPPPPQAIPRIMNQGGYTSRAKYGVVDNLKKEK